MRSGLSLVAGALLGASQAPTVHIDLTPIIVAMLSCIGVLASAGFLVNRYQRRRDIAEADLAKAQIPMTHAQYENFISEAIQRVQEVSETAITRLEKELAESNRKIAELETELEKVKGDRDRISAERDRRERELRLEIQHLREHVIDLERRLEAHGVTPRRISDHPLQDMGPDDEYRRGAKPE